MMKVIMIDRNEFEKLVNLALSDLPQKYAEKLENVAVVIEDYPSSSKLRSLGLTSPFSLFGLYEGVPKTRRGVSYSSVPPDKITIFYLPLIYYFSTPSEIKREVKKVVLHEIGHHFGLSDTELP